VWTGALTLSGIFSNIGLTGPDAADAADADAADAADAATAEA